MVTAVTREATSLPITLEAVIGAGLAAGVDKGEPRGALAGAQPCLV